MTILARRLVETISKLGIDSTKNLEKLSSKMMRTKPIKTTIEIYKLSKGEIQ